MLVYEIRLINSAGCVLDRELVREGDDPNEVLRGLLVYLGEWVLQPGDRIEISDLFEMAD